MKYRFVVVERTACDNIQTHTLVEEDRWTANLMIEVLERSIKERHGSVLFQDVITVEK